MSSFKELRSRLSTICRGCLTAFGLAHQLALASQPAHTLQAPSEAPPPAIELGATLNVSWQSGVNALTHRDKGIGLGHSDLNAQASLTPWLKGRFSASAHSDHNQIDGRIEEALIEAPGLAGGLQLRAGRFLSQIGYLNENHPHTDDFVMRPLLHRAFLGGHYFDDGARLNWVLPTALYWRVGAEMLQGKRLPTRYSSGGAGAYTLSTRTGGDIRRSMSWQLGWATLRHRPGAEGAAGDLHESHSAESSAAEIAHPVSHAAMFFGRTLDVIEVVWKWAPNGNARAQQLRISLEHAKVSDFGDAAASNPRHSAWYLSTVYRFQAQWEAGARCDRLKAMARHALAYEPARLDECSVSVAWKANPETVARIQWTQQVDRGGFAEASEIKPGRSLYLQFVRSFGAHGAHSY